MSGQDETPGLDRARIAAAVKWAVDDHPTLLTQGDLEKAARISHSTASKIYNANPAVKVTKLRQVSRALDEPQELLEVIGVGDIGQLEAIEPSPKYVAWLRRRLTPTATGSNQTA